MTIFLLNVDLYHIGCCKKDTVGRMNVEVEKGQYPRTIEHVHKGRGTYEKDHVHFTDGTALNNDGTWKHGERDITNHERQWLDKHNGVLPE